MVTHGYVVYKYNGIFYTFYNHSDSYPEYLGFYLLEELKKIVKEEKISLIKDLLPKIPTRHNFSEGDNYINGIFNSIVYHKDRKYITSNKLYSSMMIDWLYLIDFDNNIFMIRNIYHKKQLLYGFSNLPDNISID